MNKCVKIIISGKVQGVGFRHWTCRQAARLGVDGWVRNLKGGEVEALFSGEESVVEEMVGLCQTGPKSAEVREVKTVVCQETYAPGFFERESI